MIIILRPDQQDYQGTAVTVDVARKLDFPKLLLMVNKVLPSIDPEVVKKRVEETYDAPVAAVLPLSEDMVALGGSDLFALRYPDHPLSHRLSEIAAQIMAQQ